MRVRCPHCHNPVEILDDSSFKDILCSTCGSNFSLLGDSEATETARMAAKTIGQFELIEQLGVGAFGEVWKANDTQLDRSVAIKIPRKGQLSDEEAEKFLREARAAAQLRHPNIVSVHEVGKTDDSVYIVSDYVEGADLKDWMRGQPLPPREAAELCAKIAEALHHAHEAGVIHRDLKPGNVMMDLDGQPHIMDFGLAKRESGEMTMTVDGAILGTPAYMSPEQAKGKGHEADRRSDVYSLGTMLFEMLTGELPFRGERRMLVVSILTEEPPKLRRLNPRVPKDLETTCLKCLEKEPERRYETAKELADDLRRYLIGEPISARPASSVESAWRWSKRHPARAGLLCTTVMALMAVVGLVVGFAYQHDLALTNAQLELRNSQLAGSQSDLGRSLYFRNVSQALSAWYAGETDRARRLLDECDSSLRHWEWQYTDTLFKTGVKTLEGHTDWVSRVAVLPSGGRVVSGGRDGIRIWNFANGQEVLALKDSRGGNVTRVDGLITSQDGRRIIAHHDISKVTVWDASHGHVMFTRPTAGPVAFDETGEQFATTTSDQTVILWDAVSGQQIGSCEGNGAEISVLALSSGGRFLASGSRDSRIDLWDTSRDKRHALVGHEGAIRCLSFSHNGMHLFSTGVWAPRFQWVKGLVWDCTTGEQVSAIEEPVNQASKLGISFFPDGTRVAICGRVYDSGTGEFLFELLGHSTGIDFSTDGKQVVTSGHDHIVRMSDADTGAVLSTFKGHTGVVEQVSCLSNAGQIVSASRDGTIKVWNMEANRESRTLIGHADHVTQLAVSPDGRWIVSGSIDKTIAIWDAVTGDKIRELEGHTEGVVCVAFTPDGQRIVSGSRGQGDMPSIRVWNALTGEEVPLIEGYGEIVLSLAVSPDGRWIVTGGVGSVKGWDARTGRPAFDIDVHDGVVWSGAFSPDGKEFASGSVELAQVWRVSNRQQRMTLAGHTHNVFGLCYSPEGDRIVTGSADNTVRTWDARSGDLQLVLHADAFVRSVAISPDGKRVAAGCSNGRIKIWETENGHEAITLQAHEGSILTVTFSPDGGKIISGGHDGTVKIWDAGTAEFVRRAG